jgi:hypothetical protein
MAGRGTLQGLGSSGIFFFGFGFAGAFVGGAAGGATGAGGAEGEVSGASINSLLNLTIRRSAKVMVYLQDIFAMKN